MINHGDQEVDSTRKHDNYLFDHGAHYLSKNHNSNQLSEILTELDLITEKEILFSTDLEKNKIIKKNFNWKKWNEFNSKKYI